MTDQELARALFQAGLLTQEQVQTAAGQRAPGRNFAQTVVGMGWVTPEQIAQFDPNALSGPLDVPTPPTPPTSPPTQPATPWPTSAPPPGSPPPGSPPPGPPGGYGVPNPGPPGGYGVPNPGPPGGVWRRLWCA